MNPHETLQELATVTALLNREAEEGVRVALELALKIGQAEAGFVARSVRGKLQLVVARDGRGEELKVSPRHLDRVFAALGEAEAGVSDAPPSMTGGEAPPGAVAVKAEAGHPPVHAFPLRGERGLLGVLGLYPSPRAPAVPDDAVAMGLNVLAGLLSRPAVRGPQAEAPPVGEGGFRYAYGEIVTQSSAMQSVFRKLDRVIGTKVPVLVVGETGTGKELIARALHRNDEERRSKRFYAQNCAAISSTLLESELFGHEKGAFTGADRRKRGLFEIADGSTLFLDEIGEMSLDMQARLLRVLQEKEVVPVGSTEPIPIDVRLVAATHRNLEEEVARGRFRNDLYYRLKVVRLELPPLRERREDVPLLVEHFLHVAARERGGTTKVLDRRDERVLNVLMDYPWPGNVRELENLVHRLVHLAAADVITYETLVEETDLVRQASSEARPVRPLDEVVEEVERAEIENALRMTNNNRTQAAALLQINRRSLLRRLQKYGYQGED
ncbi:MAG: sigma 54-interacting transcriptional regulator [Planctomycetes bacterium]|nr:sigma 54-interacting transcriptional regulator [Planctomycetota bacterium]